MIRYGLIPAAGRGLRTYPKNKFIPKAMFEIESEPLIYHTINIFKTQLRIKDVFVIIGYLGDQIKDYLGNGSKIGLNIEYIICDDPAIGLAKGIALGKDRIKDCFITILGDELYYNSNHNNILDIVNIKKDFNVICGVRNAFYEKEIKKNYLVEVEKGEIIRCEEKPKKISSRIMGCGTYVFTPEIFNDIENTTISPRSNRVELTDVINNIANYKKRVYPFPIEGEYVNINTIEDYNLAVYKVRTHNWNNYKISLIIPAYNEGSSIGDVIKDFNSYTDEILVINNYSADDTEKVSNDLGAKVMTKKLKGYGDALRYGMENASGDILILTEADGSFKAKDLPKILEYLKDADMVIGTRTTRQLTEQGTNMKGIVRWVDVIFGKIVELFWWYLEPRFTDVGCTYRGIWKNAYLTIGKNLISNGPEFSVEMMIEILRARRRIIEIPISYYPRLGGVSKHSKGFLRLSKTALRMLKIIIDRRFMQ